MSKPSHRLASFAWTAAHENPRPTSQSGVKVCPPLSARHHMSPCPLRRDIHWTSTNTLGVSFFAPRLRRGLAWPSLPVSRHGFGGVYPVREGLMGSYLP